MTELGGLRETSDVSESNKESRHEISQGVVAKFEKLMGDDKLPETAKKPEKNDVSLSDLLAKFESLFKSEAPIAEDMVTHIKTINEDLEGNTYPGTNVMYKRHTIALNGEKIEGVFPEFKSIYDVYLPDDLLNASDTEQFKYCTQQLAERIKKDPLFAMQFTPRQLEQIKNGEPRISGLTWHHNEEPGKMQLVDADTHNICRHTGGKNIWGGGKDHR